MTADNPAALRAAPLLPLLCQEFLHALFLDLFEVFYHTHMVFAAVALIQGFQTPAGIIPAFKAKLHPSFPQQFAVLFHEDTILAARQAAGAVRLFESLFLQVVFQGQIIDA
jgi:hypothetical protein